MSAVVVRAQGKHAVVLNSDGVFVRVRNRGYRVGQRIDLMRGRWGGAAKAVATAAACLCLFISSVALAASKWVPFSYVSLDVNPSIEYALNYWDEVLSISAVNADADAVLDQMEKVPYETISDAISRTLAILSSCGYAADYNNYVLLGVASYGSTEELTYRVKASADAATSAQVVVESINYEDVREAKKKDVSAGKLCLAKLEMAEASETDQGVQLTDWLDRPVGELLKNRAVRNAGQDVPVFSEPITVQQENPANPDAEAASLPGMENTFPEGHTASEPQSPMVDAERAEKQIEALVTDQKGAPASPSGEQFVGGGSDSVAVRQPGNAGYTENTENAGNTSNESNLQTENIKNADEKRPHEAQLPQMGNNPIQDGNFHGEEKPQ